MNKTSTKKLFFYISTSLILCYFLFVLLMYNSNQMSELYTLKQCGIYYMIVYLLLTATNYVIDTQTRKEPAFLTLFALPTFTLLFLLGMMLIAGSLWTLIVVLLLVVSLLYVFAYYAYKKWIEKILLIKNGYDNILMIYVILHLLVVLYIAFRLLNLL